MSQKPLEHEFEYFIAHQRELVMKHRGKVIVIKGDAVIGVYQSALEAVRETSRDHPVGTFLVQSCEPGPKAYTATFHGFHVGVTS